MQIIELKGHTEFKQWSFISEMEWAALIAFFAILNT